MLTSTKQAYGRNIASATSYNSRHNLILHFRRFSTAQELAQQTILFFVALEILLHAGLCTRIAVQCSWSPDPTGRCGVTVNCLHHRDPSTSSLNLHQCTAFSVALVYLHNAVTLHVGL